MTDRQYPPSTTAVAAYFDDLYKTLARSPTQRRTVAAVLSEELAGLLGYAGPEELGWIAEAAGIRARSLVLDVCCGAGDVARWLATDMGAVSVGVDRARQSLILGTRAGGGAGLVSGDADTMPFATLVPLTPLSQSTVSATAPRCSCGNVAACCARAGGWACSCRWRRLPARKSREPWPIRGSGVLPSKS